MTPYPIIATGCASGVNRSKIELDDTVEKAMGKAILQALDDGCDEVEMKRRMLNARDKAVEANNVYSKIA